ncbi:hypothetical protein EYF80_031864 [Liparis tanakae]|uniref:Uncharacterized protein n=1 Tax=Liparis tanakae TaxID=230148 RepID=A0A4Z2GWI9_9TELE|nr:hypothetical protein EYF80_031864 [Liparis tanakae]
MEMDRACSSTYALQDFLREKHLHRAMTRWTPAFWGIGPELMLMPKGCGLLPSLAGTSARASPKHWQTKTTPTRSSNVFTAAISKCSRGFLSVFLAHRFPADSVTLLPLRLLLKNGNLPLRCTELCLLFQRVPQRARLESANGQPGIEDEEFGNVSGEGTCFPFIASFRKDNLDHMLIEVPRVELQSRTAAAAFVMPGHLTNSKVKKS